jgi:glycerate kinase
MEIQGQVERITFHNEENGYTIARMKVSGNRELITIVGNLLSITPGEILKLQGEWKNHPKYGEQFLIQSYESVVPASVKGVEKYLGSGLIKGIGPVMAKRLVNKFGIETLEIIEKDIQKLQEVEGIGTKRIAMIKKVIVAIGGSATNDGGMGALAALGVKFYDENQKLLSGMGENLPKVQTIDTEGVEKAMNEVEILIASDVKNPLFGPEGAASVYAPQKGANEEDVLFLDKGLVHFSKMIKEKTGKEVDSIPGSGAAGGIGAGFCGFFNAQITSGIQLIMELLNFEEEITTSDLIISGEGKIDQQTLYGKVISGIYELCQRHNKPLMLLAGKIEEEAYSIYGDKVLALFSIVNGPINENEAFLKASYLLENVSYNIAKLIFRNFI